MLEYQSTLSPTQSDLYKKLCDLLTYMKKNITRFPKFKAFLWTLTSRNIVPEEYGVENKDELEEQAKLVNSFLKLAYWYIGINYYTYPLLILLILIS